MTFQLAVVGSDGLIVGSDRRISVTSGQSSGKGDWQTIAGSKFVKRGDDAVICFHAGGPRSSSIARAIVGRADPFELSESRWQSSLAEITDSVPAEYSSGDEVLVIRKHVPDVVLVTAGRTGNAAGVQKIEQRICTGVAVTARFMTQHLWRRVSVAKIKPLVLLTLDYATREQPGSVGEGFDVLTITGTVASWENYALDDKRIVSIRQSFSSAAHGAIYG